MKLLHKIIVGTVQLFVAYAASAEVEIVPLTSSVFNNTRNVRVYLPPGYGNTSERYSVLYLTDGIASFHAYNLERVADSLIQNRIIAPLIIVGIDNGGSTAESTNPIRDRANEYLPWPDLAETDQRLINPVPEGKKFPQFFFQEVVPLINSKYRTRKGHKNIALGGASYGALISLYTAATNSGKLGGLLLESPSLYVHNQQIFTERLEGIMKMKIYIGIGTEEGETATIQQMAVDGCERLYRTTESTNDVHFELSRGADHSFDSFAQRFPKALAFLFAFN